MSMLTRRHDRYVLRSYLGTFTGVLLFFTLIVMVVDLSDGITKYSRQWDAVKALGYKPGLLLVEHYLTLIPFIWVRIMPFVVSIAAAFCLARLSRHNELVGLVTTGVSIKRAVRPILFAGLAIAALMILAQSTVLSPLSQRHARLRRILEKRSPDRVSRIKHFHDPSGARLSMDAYLPLARRMEAAWVTQWGPDGLGELRWYPELAWDDEAGAWLASAGGERIPYQGIETGQRRIPIAIGEPAPLQASLQLIETSLTATDSLGLSYDEAASLVAAQPDDPKLRLSLHQLYATPVSIAVLLMLVLPFAVRIGRRTKGVLPGMIASLGIGGLFFGFSYLCNGLAAGGEFNPVVLAWLPTVLFASLGLAMYLSLDG